MLFPLRILSIVLLGAFIAFLTVSFSKELLISTFADKIFNSEALLQVLPQKELKVPQQAPQKRKILAPTQNISFAIEREFWLSQIKKPLLKHWPGIQFSLDHHRMGAKIKTIAKNHLLSLLGFQSGDILLSINGNSVLNLPALMQLWQKREQLPQLEVVYVRAAQKFRANYQLPKV